MRLTDFQLSHQMLALVAQISVIVVALNRCRVIAKFELDKDFRVQEHYSLLYQLPKIVHINGFNNFSLLQTIYISDILTLAPATFVKSIGEPYSC